jgi:Kinetochore complex Sim4 subunit Fta1
MVTPLHALRDLALQPRKSSFFHLTRISAFQQADFQVKRFSTYSSQFTDHLIRAFRITNGVNKDSTIGVFRELKSNFDESDIEGELGLCCVIEARVAPDHAKIDGTLGPRTSSCDVVLCLGRSQPDGFKFAFALTRGRIAVIQATLDFLKRAFGAETVPATVAPHHLMFLAREWTRDLDEDEGGEDLIVREEGRKFKRLARLEMVFTLPASIGSTSGAAPPNGEVESIHVMVEEDSLRALHGLVEKSEASNADLRARKEPALVAALATHISKHIHVDLTGAGVTMIVTPTAELSSDGNVRFLWPAHLKRALLHLAEVSKARAEQLDM